MEGCEDRISALKAEESSLLEAVVKERLVKRQQAEKGLTGTCWIGGSFGSVPDGAVRAGRDKDGGALFVGRAYFETDILPAKIVPNHGAAYVSFDGQEHQVMHYEVLCGGEAMWQVASDGQVPTNAFPVGSTRDGERLYVGRVFHDGTITPGKVNS
ncbi:hypothetical protein B7P43_G01349 [Cryptotermes secundus]|uniref:Uncharacterized protein n=1 Tax=Cryptotermes secundus TaxID=105785 RepID=A0A2J7RE84_9NEOP|nr:hypothetical protein B7P43_G01349 [Cryptotermes secundus]